MRRLRIVLTVAAVAVGLAMISGLGTTTASPASPAAVPAAAPAVTSAAAPAVTSAAAAAVTSAAAAVTSAAAPAVTSTAPAVTSAAAPTAAPAEAGAVDPGQDPDAEAASPAPNGDGSARVGSVSELAADRVDGPVSGSRPTTGGPSADPAAKSAAVWTAHGRPDRLIIVRRSGIDTVANGRLVRHVKRPIGTVGLRGLLSSVPSAWLSVDGTTARLSATLVLSTGVTLNAGAPITALFLTGGAEPSAAASVFTGGGGLGLRGVVVSSADPVTEAPMPIGPGRPFILVSGGGRLDASDAVLGDLGAAIGPRTYAGLEIDGGGGSLVRTTLQGNTIGLRLDRSDGVRLEDVTVTRSAANGLVLSGDRGSALSGVRAVDNGKNGVIVSGRSSPRPITGITTQGNHDFGIVVDGQAGPRISAIATTADGAGGMEINHSTDVAITGFTAVDEPIAIYTHVSSARIALDQLTVTGGRQGVVVEKTTNDLTLARSRIDGAELGVSLGGHRIRLTDVTVIDALTAAVVERGAGDVDFDRLAIQGGEDGLIANPGTAGVTVRDLAADRVSGTAVRASSPGQQILGGRIDGSSTGIDVQASLALSGITIIGADTGVRVRTPMSVRADQIDVTAISVGINVADGTPFVLSDSRVHALESIRGAATPNGSNDLSLPALSVLGAIGVPLTLLALGLEVVAALRQRRSARRRKRAAEGMAERAAERVEPAPRPRPVVAAR